MPYELTSLVPEALKMLLSTSFQVCKLAVSKMCLFEFCFQYLPFFKSGSKIVPLFVNKKPIHRIFDRFQNVPALCECSLNSLMASPKIRNM